MKIKATTFVSFVLGNAPHALIGTQQQGGGDDMNMYVLFWNLGSMSEKMKKMCNKADKIVT